MKGKLIPVIFGVLFFSTIFSAQDVYGPHFTSLDGIRYHFQGTVDSFFDVFVDVSEGHANSKKNADFEICVHLETATDTTIPTEIIALELVSCDPIIVGDSDQKNFKLLHFTLDTEPIIVSSGIADISGFIVLTNPGGQSVGGVTEFTARGVELGIPACIPPTCENNCHGHGVCVADDTCVCEKGWDSLPNCSVPECDEDNPCRDDGNQCTLEVCHDNQCVVSQIPECTACEPSGDEVCDGIDNDCDGAVDEDFDLGTACSAGEGICQRIGVTVCDSSGTGTICTASPASPSTEGDAATCTDGIDNNCDGFTDCTDPTCIELGITCSLPLLCNSDADCDDGNVCTLDTCSPTDPNADPDGCVVIPDPNGVGQACGSQVDTACDNPNTCDNNGACTPNYEPAGTQCGTNASCDGAGVCVPSGECAGQDDGTPCNDGLFCTASDVCQGGICVGFGDPCTGNIGDGDLDCSESCNESAASCTANDPIGSVCSEGVCDGIGTCVDPGAVPSTNDLLISEVFYNMVGFDDFEFIEIINPTSNPISLVNVSVDLINGNDCLPYASYDLSPFLSLRPSSFLVIGSASVVSSLPSGTPSILASENFIQNGPDKVTIFDNDSLFIIDELGYGNLPSVCGPFEGTPHPGAPEGFSLGRSNSIQDTGDNSVDFSIMIPTPSAVNPSSP